MNKILYSHLYNMSICQVVLRKSQAVFREKGTFVVSGILTVFCSIRFYCTNNDCRKNDLKAASYCFFKSSINASFNFKKCPWIFPKRMKLKLCMNWFWWHQTFLMDKLLWQHWRFEMTENFPSIQIISETCSETI